jgi:hypothetical protein
MGWRGLNSYGSGEGWEGQVACCCENGNEHSVTIIYGEFLDLLWKY